jgi:hypothetical protein
LRKKQRKLKRVLTLKECFESLFSKAERGFFSKVQFLYKFEKLKGRAIKAGKGEELRILYKEWKLKGREQNEIL